MITVTYKDEHKEKFTDFESAPDPENVVKIVIENDNTLTSLNGIGRFINLTRLDCDTTNLSSLGDIENCAKLRTVALEDCNSLVSLKGLENHTSIEAFSLCNTSVESLDELKNCTDMYELQCSSNKLTYIPDFITNLKKLEYFDFDEENVTSVPYKVHKFLMYWSNHSGVKWGIHLYRMEMRNEKGVPDFLKCQGTLLNRINPIYTKNLEKYS
jgi:Leucine-rich repeat (LRR) protein